jgi:NADH dehydrogenase
MTRAVILGGGFGGLAAARALAASPVQVTVVDRNNYHLFQPLLYQVATAGLSAGDIASPIRWILRHQSNARVMLATALSVDAGRTRVELDTGELAYDYLIVATGVTHAYFGHDEWASFAPGLKTLGDALDIRKRLLLAFERAEEETDPARQRALLTFVIVGAGPTGVELAGALAEIARHTLAHEFRSIRPGCARIILVEAGPQVLPTFAAPLQAAASRSLARLGVEVRLGRAVEDMGADWVRIGGERVSAATVLWAAGVSGPPLGRTLGVPLDRAGRVVVEPDLSVPGHPNVYVIGDLAAMAAPDGTPLPGVAAVAVQQGRHAAVNVRRSLEGRPTEPFRYRNPGSLATIGRAAAVADFGRLRLTGWVAWVTWLFVHIMKLVGFRNRVLVFVQWAWAYFTFQRSARLISSDRNGDTGDE